ncbi:MAG: protein-glutamate O-methyltransferase CheR [Planctomycetota bacterium]
MNEIIAIMTDRHGLDVSPFEESFLAKSCQQRMEILGIPTVAAYHAYLAGSGEEAQALFQGLRVAHSEFFRNPLGFALLEQVVLPGLARARKADGGGKIRIWSAACAAGQEAYSLAILMNELVGERQNGLSYHIFATDVSPLQVALAAEGLYDPASMLNVRAKHLEACFTRQGEAWRIAPRLREAVDFSQYDLLDQCSGSPPRSIYGDFDLIVCSNLLFYYRPDFQRAILDKLYRALSPMGYLMTGEAERAIVEACPGFLPVAPPAAVFRKTARMER